MAVFDNLNYTHSEGVSPSVVQYYDRTLLENMRAEMVHTRDMQKRPLPQNNGKTVNFRRFTPFKAITEPLKEGVTPDGQSLEETAFTAMVKPYGGYVETTDELNLYMLDNMHQETARLLSDQASLSLDTIARNAENAGLNVQYTGSKTSRAALSKTDKVTASDIQKAVLTLKNRNVRPFADGYYHAIVHPNVVFDLMNDPLWIDIAKYQDKSKVERYELGCMYKVKFFESTNAKTFAANTHIFGTKTAYTAAANYDATSRTLTVTEDITADDARALTGMMVAVQFTKSSANTTEDVCIERVDYKNKKIVLRWNPKCASDLTTAQSAKIVPTGGASSGDTVYSTLIYGQNAFGSIELGGNGRNVETIIKPVGSSGATDPLNQRATIGWKVKGFCVVILQDDFVVRLESGATMG